MLDALSPVFVDIATTPPSHRALVELCAPRTRLVICQKPIADTHSDARAMVAACEAAGVPLLIHENFRWQQPFMRMQELLRQGAIGTPRSLHLSFRHRWDVYAGQPYLAAVPRLAIMDMGVHLSTSCASFLARPKQSPAKYSAAIPRRGRGQLHRPDPSPGGAVGVTDCSFHTLRRPEPFPQTLARLEATTARWSSSRTTASSSTTPQVGARRT
jgi:predicted dehydrogenase